MLLVISPVPIGIGSTLRAVGARLPTIHGNRENVETGGLMSYGPNFPTFYRRAADFVDKILRGAKPADLPGRAADKFDLTINLKTAKAIGLKVRRVSTRSAPTR